MSLLMEALKKAEAAKRQSQTDASALSPAENMAPMELAPLGAAENVPVVSSPLETMPITSDSIPKLESLDADFLPPPAPVKRRIESAPASSSDIPYEPLISESRQNRDSMGAPKPVTTNTKSSEQQDAAKNLFAAKTQPNSRRNQAIALGLFGFLALASIGIYFWLQLQPKSSLSPVAGTLRQPPAPPVQTTPVVAVAPPPAQVADTTVPEEDEPPATPPRSRDGDTSARIATPPSPIRVTASKVKLDPSLERGYAALIRGDIPQAKTAYEAALNSDPNNIDALHGLAAVYQHLGNSIQAEQHFRRALEVDPKDNLALAALINLHGQASQPQAESRLKSALADRPDDPATNFALGNLYSQQDRWGDAQQAYFRAMTGDPENADYLFNLAVALDHLHQEKLAAQFYGRALDAIQKRAGGFDPAQVSERLKKLQP